MTFGSGPQAVSDHLLDNWQVSRSGRNDVPDVLRDSGNNRIRDPQQAVDPGKVLHYYDRFEPNVNRGAWDLVHCYHPEAGGIDWADSGFNEKTTTETIQIDLETVDRRDPSDDTRARARERMVGDRDDAGFPSDESPPYPGILGETLYLLEDVRRNFNEWDVARIQPLTVNLKHSECVVRLEVALEHVVTNVV
jgi:hypothetical protein